MPRFFLKTLILSSFIVYHSSFIIAQHPAWHNYSSTDGLPSNEVYGMMEDSRGFLWFATDQGLCRFNGYEFTRPIDSSAAASGSAFKIMEDAQGRVWLSRLDATLWLVENDTVRPWQHNHVLDEYRGKYSLFTGFALEKDGTVWLSLTRLGFLVVRPDGTHRVVPGLNQIACIFSEVNGKVIYTDEDNKDTHLAESQFEHQSGLSAEVFRWQQDKAVPLGRFPLKFGNKVSLIRACRLQNSDFLICMGETFYLLRDNYLVWYGQKNVRAEEIYEDTDGSILLASMGKENPGLLQFRSLDDFHRNEFKNLLPGHLVTAVLRDREGGLWASTRDAGVFYCKNPSLDIFDASVGLPSSDILRLTSDGHGTVFAGLRPLALCAIRRTDGHVERLASPPLSVVSELSTLRFDTLTGRLWCSPDLCFLEHKHWSIIQYFDPSNHQNASIPIKKITSDPSGTNWWANMSWGFFTVDRRTSATRMIVGKSSEYERIFSVTPDISGNLWITTLKGLRLWRNGRYEPPPFDHPALRFPARNVEMLPGGSMVISLRGGGLLIRDKDGVFTHFNTLDGLTSDVLSDLDITPAGQIYACSNAGLNILSPRPDGGWRIETLTTKHGLPSNQVNDVALLGDEIWIATDKGIARLREIPRPVPMPAPVLETFVVNNRDTVFTSNLRLAYKQNNIAIRFFALHFRSSGNIPYRYRLLQADTTFTYTYTRTANFSLLPPGRYVFEVQAQNEDGQWSEPSRWPFEICPPWWAAWWFRILVSTALIAGAYFFYRNRVRAVRQEAALREKAHEMETAALRAQMNPHFIFNCLQAIQSFIAQNDRDAAAAYLARFAKLVRLALHSSVDGRHSLGEEMAMLENYLYLEQLRFGGIFGFTVRVEDGLDPAGITLPPLMVQPFVENALVHGLHGKESDGRIEVLFARKGGQLEVSVTDNGAGFSEGKATDARPHKSVGMMLTQKRLDLLAGIRESGEERLVRETVRDENGMVVGARVRIWIPLME